MNGSTVKQQPFIYIVACTQSGKTVWLKHTFGKCLIHRQSPSWTCYLVIIKYYYLNSTLTEFEIVFSNGFNLTLVIGNYYVKLIKNFQVQRKCIVMHHRDPTWSVAFSYLNKWFAKLFKIYQCSIICWWHQLVMRGKIILWNCTKIEYRSY